MFGDGPDNDGDGTADYQMLQREETLRMVYDLQSMFEVVDVRGVVRAE